MQKLNIKMENEKAKFKKRETTNHTNKTNMKKGNGHG
jgi:hypothetical protein